MIAPLMPKATALWLIKNTKLTFRQIADFTDMHVLEVQNLADKIDEATLVPFDPVMSGQITQAEITRCENDPSLSPKINDIVRHDKSANEKQAKYVPLAKRGDRPNAIGWVIKFYPNIPDKEIVKLLRTTITMVQGIRGKTYWNVKNLQIQSPVKLGLCTQDELDQLIERFSS